jgi:phosphoketolase
MPQQTLPETYRTADWAEQYRDRNPAADRWAGGYGVIDHNLVTQMRVFELAERLALEEGENQKKQFFDHLYALDRLASAGMWLVVHEVYARNVYLDGRDLQAEDFKKDPEGHTGGSLNMVPAYVGYLGANAITGKTRSWLMGQGHCVAAIDSVNLLVDNLLPIHEKRYLGKDGNPRLTDEGLTRYVRDFYSYRINDQGKQESPLGSHVNPHTAGGMAEGGYLGFAQLEYVHMPLPGETLVTFLSDGAFEEQRGSDWVPRWWRAQDCGKALPIMINNGRRIDQRSTMAQKGGTDWFERHLELNHFDPITIDGRDPAAFVWLILEMEARLTAETEAIEQDNATYPANLPYGIAVADKGAGFFNAGENLAHNLPLGGNPRQDEQMAQRFNEHTRRLWVPEDELEQSITQLQNHQQQQRPREKDHPLVNRQVSLSQVPEPEYQDIPEDRANPDHWIQAQPMKGVDAQFLATVKANPDLRVRVGNPDEMKSNRLQKTLDYLKFRVTAPEDGIPEALDGAVITALNEEAVACAALANKGGISLIDTYEAFGAKMHGAMRQEIIFTRHRKGLGMDNGWLSIPLVLTSHTWENGKNEQSHQDTMMAEAMLNEASDVSRVMFAADYNSALALMHRIYQTKGEFWTLVVSKRGVANLLTADESNRLLDQGAIRLDWAGHKLEDPQVILTAIGGYQLEEVLKASQRLRHHDLPHSVVYMLEPGRFRIPRDGGELAHAAAASHLQWLYPSTTLSRVFVTHTRPEPMAGTLQPLHTGYTSTRFLGFVNQGGTLDKDGMLFINRCTWAHVLAEVAQVLDRPLDDWLSQEELDALHGRQSPQGVLI